MSDDASPPSAWEPFDSGATVGTAGPDGGCILRDEEHPAGVRITLERGGFAPLGITCGIYGRFMHTAFAQSDAEAFAKYEAMKRRLTELIEGDSDLDEELSEFAERF